MKQQHIDILNSVARLFPSGSYVSIDNAHDPFNLIDKLVPVFLHDGAPHVDEARYHLIERGMSKSVAKEIADVIEIVGITVRAVQRHR